MLAGKLEPALRSDCEALAGKSTLDRLEHTPKRHAAKYHKIDCDGARVDGLLVDVFLEAHERAPREIVLDLDNTDIPLHGGRRVDFSTAITTNIAICRCMSFVDGICCWRSSGAPMSQAAMARSRTWRALFHTFAGAGHGYASFCAATAAFPMTT